MSDTLESILYACAAAQESPESMDLLVVIRLAAEKLRAMDERIAVQRRQIVQLQEELDLCNNPVI